MKLYRGDECATHLECQQNFSPNWYCRDMRAMWPGGNITVANRCAQCDVCCRHADGINNECPADCGCPVSPLTCQRRGQLYCDGVHCDKAATCPELLKEDCLNDPSGECQRRTCTRRDHPNCALAPG